MINILLSFGSLWIIGLIAIAIALHKEKDPTKIANA